MSTKEKFLDFVYIGAPRAGSTWLAAAFDEHPQVWVPPSKEVNFFLTRCIYPFSVRYHLGIEHYRKEFKDAPQDVTLGDMSPLYYYDPHSAYKIHQHFPDVKILAFLRNPANVVFSQYLKRRQYEKREKTFEKELLYNPQFLDLGFYHRQLTPYFDRFDASQIKVVIYERFFDNPKEGFADVCRFLGVDDSFHPTVIGQKLNTSRPPKSAPLVWIKGNILKTLNRRSMLPVKMFLHNLGMDKVSYEERKKNKSSNDMPKLSQETRMSMMDQYEHDIRRLEKLLDTNLKEWRE